jgi:hypothetical protein
MNIKNKRGQIAWFLVLGFIILIGFAFTIYIRNTGKLKSGIEKTAEVPFAVQPVELFVENCLKSELDRGIQFISRHGGIIQSNSFIIWDNLSVPYFFKNKIDISPSLSDVELTLSKYIELNLNNCLKDFTPLKQIGFEITASKPSAKTEIFKKSVNSVINLPLIIRFEGSETKLDTFRVQINSNLKKMFDTSKDIVYFHKNDQEFVPLSKIMDLSIEKNITARILELKNTGIVFLIDKEAFPKSDFAENTSFIDEERLIFSFAIEYNWNDSAYLQNKKLIENTEDKTAYVGYKFSDKINKLYDDTTFFDYTDLFDIDKKSGLIEFVPKENNAGQYPNLIEAMDSNGNKDFTTFNLKIIGENKATVIEEIPDIKAKVNQKFSYKVIAKDQDSDPVFFSDNSPLFDINTLTGQIDFVPKNVSVEYITITATNIKGSSTNESFLLSIENE